MASPYGHTQVVNVGDNVKVRLREPLRFSVKAASTANVSSLSAASSTVDGVSCADGDIVLLKNQSTASQNGVYAFSGISGGAGVLTRVAPIADGWEPFPGTRFYVESGTVNGGLEFALTTTGAITIGSTSLAFAAVSQPLASVQAVVPGLSLYDFREVNSSGDVGDTTANGGLLASDTTPILRGNAAETQEISWATGNTDLISAQVSLPLDFDGTADCSVDLWVNSGTTDAATFTVETGWDGGALVSDSADDSATKSATTHKISATVAAADIPDSPSFLTVILTPAAHATNAIQLLAWRIVYKRKPLNS